MLTVPLRRRGRVKRSYCISAMGLDPGEEEIGADAPAGDLGRGQQDGQDEAPFGAVDDAERGVPVADGQVERDGGGDDGEVENKQRESGERERDGIVERALVFQALDPPLLPAGLKT